MQVRAGEWERRLQEIPRRLQRLRQRWRGDWDARFLRTREGWILGYSGEIAVTEDHLISGQPITQQASDNESLLPMVDEVMRQCRGKPEVVSADTGFFLSATCMGYVSGRWMVTCQIPT